MMRLSFMIIKLIFIIGEDANTLNVLNVSVLLANDNSRVAMLALEKGVEDAKAFYNINISYTIKSYEIKRVDSEHLYEDQCNDMESIKQTNEIMTKRDEVQAFFAPTCSADLNYVSRLVSFHHIPVFSAGGMYLERTRTRPFEYLNKIAFNFVGFASFLKRLADDRSLDKLFFVLHETRGYTYVSDSFVRVIKHSENARPIRIRIYTVYSGNNPSQSYADLLSNLRLNHTHGSVVVYFGPEKMVPHVMEGAYMANLVNGTCMFVYPSAKEVKQLKDWRTGTSRDYIHRRAYLVLSYLTISPSTRNQTIQFAKNLVQRASEKHVKVKASSVNFQTASYYDAIIYMASAYNLSLMGGGANCQGNFGKCKWKRVIPSAATGNIKMDEYGNRIWKMDLVLAKCTTGKTMQTLFSYSLSDNALQEMTDVSNVWFGSQFPKNVTIIPSGIKPINMRRESFFVVFLAFVPVLLLYIIAFATERIRRRREDSEYLLIDWDELNGNRKFATVNESDSESISHQAHPTTVAKYAGRLVALRYFNLPDIDLSNKSGVVAKEIRVLQRLNHPNCNTFIGLCNSPGHTCIVSEYCHKGSLQDLLSRESITLDWNFRYSMLNDLIQGLAYIHSSPLKVHGRLTSSNCLVDRRFVLKLTDYGPSSIMKALDQNNEPAVLARQLWVAPELLFQGVKVTREGDMYSVGIIMGELITREKPYSRSRMKVEEICEQVAKNLDPPFRPEIDQSKCSMDMFEMMKSCWHNNPRKRLTAQNASKRIVEITSGQFIGNLVEQYADNLEELVEDRTKDFLAEKKKSEDLLHKMLPKAIAAKLALGESVEPEFFDSATVLFSNIVDFPEQAAGCSAIRVIELIDEMNLIFDKMVERFDITKLDAIGDACMVVSGAPIRNGNLHAREMANMALAVMNIIHTGLLKPLKPLTPIALRMGISSGPLCAGIVGQSLPKYTVFGDTVNTASRMESNGLPTKIQISSPTHDLLETFTSFKMMYRGEQMIKGKGQIKTYWLLGQEEGTSSSRWRGAVSSVFTQMRRKT